MQMIKAILQLIPLLIFFTNTTPTPPPRCVNITRGIKRISTQVHFFFWGGGAISAELNMFLESLHYNFFRLFFLMQHTSRNSFFRYKDSQSGNISWLDSSSAHVYFTLVSFRVNRSLTKCCRRRNLMVFTCHENCSHVCVFYWLVSYDVHMFTFPCLLPRLLA